VPRWFPEVPDHEFLTFSEVCDVLPIDAQKYLVRGSRLHELWPHLQREGAAAPEGHISSATWELRDADLGPLYEHSQVPWSGDELATLWFPRRYVEGFLDGWRPMPHLDSDTPPLPWESKPKRRGPKRVRWRVLLEEATAAKGSRLTREAALEAIRAGSVAVVETERGYSFDGVAVATGTFRNALRDAAKK
jgi:hypothetical protein